MTITLLIMAIKKFLEKELADDMLPIPTVLLGYLNQSTASSAGYPVIMILPAEGEGATSKDEIQVKLFFGTQSEDSTGLIDLLNLMDRVRILLLRQRVLEQKFAMDGSWKWKMNEEHSSSEWGGELTTTWALPQIRQEVQL
ncbi:hypothetical protein [Paenibacillus riograndensis]|uniref:Uncharacterized protein n=2 Tax=Paenibacillus riograndensis TaxID=483937 RepID=A0A132U561_9BACL|nr:hypothetical protein [Paenibacillus riograndensis]KWX78675.1 hypothetical protein AMQ84_08775 [Paenibacillus riograndensis]CQR58450.1 hypothetical protein PRIO_6099 [Paenibacillus riograndensis SBR5]